MRSTRRVVYAMVALLSLPLFSGCIISEKEVASAPPPPAPTTTTVVVAPSPQAPPRVVTYTDGRWELRGDGRTVQYYWVWVPVGVTVSAPPTPPTTVVVSPSLQRTMTYPNGRYELRGDGTVVPYYWVWIPTGYNPPWPPHPSS